MDSAVFAPLSGPVVPLGDVPDPVFAQRMAGDGLAIDPVDNRVLSPCDGKVVQVHRKQHAVTLATDEGAEILIHVGIETVNLNGEGFQVRCSEGQRVNKGEPLLEFDADLIVRRAKSLVTVVLIANADRFSLKDPFHGLAEAGSTRLFSVEIPEGAIAQAAPAADSGLPRSESEPIVIEAEHGIHARPAATLADTARRFKRAVEVVVASQLVVEQPLALVARQLCSHERAHVDGPVEPDAAGQVVRDALVDGDVPAAVDADEVRLRDVRDPRQGGDVEWPPVVAIHRVSRPKHPAV